jgi:16S rRNA (uracil1498-N3)-methyltransferase
MRTHRFFGAFTVDGSSVRVVDRELVHQMTAVLRLRPGEHIVLFDGSGEEAVIELRRIGKGEVVGALVERRRNSAEPARRVTLYCALLKRENFEYVVEKAVEAGAARIVPVITARTVKQGLRLDRMRRIAKEAAEQSGRGVVPEVTEPMPLVAAMDDTERLGPAVFFDIDAPALARDAMGDGSTVGIFIGPEGGWTPEESEAAAKGGLIVAGLGPLTLRAETAAIIATYVVVHA